MDFLNNPWIIGIGGGILSGFIVTIVSRRVFSKRDNREYAQKTLGANREVIYAIRPGISEGLTPEFEIVEALIFATARKYGVEKSDLYDPREIAQELVKEVMDSSFISAKTKEEYCKQLSSLSTESSPSQPVEKDRSTEVRIKSTPGLEEYRTRIARMTSVMAGVLTASMTLVLALSKDGSFSSDAFDFGGSFSTLLVPMTASMLIVIASAAIFPLMRDINSRSRRIRSAKEVNHGKAEDDEERAA